MGRAGDTARVSALSRALRLQRPQDATSVEEALDAHYPRISASLMQCASDEGPDSGGSMAGSTTFPEPQCRDNCPTRRMPTASALLRADRASLTGW